MANIENNKDKNNSNITEKIGDSVNQTIDNIKDNIKSTVENPIESVEASLNQAKEDVKKLSWWAKLFLWLMFIFSVLFIALLVVINLPVTKNWAANRVLNILNQDFQTRITTEHIEVNYFGDVIITGLTIKDHKNFDFLKAQQLRADSDWLMMISNSRDLTFSTLSLTGADVKVITYKGEETDNFNRYIEKFDSGKKADPNRPPFKLSSRILIKDSKISIVNQNSDEAGKWLKAENVNAYASSLNVVGPNVKLKLNRLGFTTERWGKKHLLETLSGDIEVTKEKLSLKDLTFNTNHSLLQGDLTFFTDKETRWKDFNNKVKWDMNLKRGSLLSGYDISYFVTQWDNHEAMDISGKMQGVLNDFTLKNFLLKAKDNEFQTGEIRLAKLMDGNFNIRTNQISTNFTYKGLKSSLPKFVSAKMGNFADDFGRLKFNGLVYINKQQVNARGNLITGVGQAQISSFTLRDFSTKNPKYNGVLTVKDLNVTALTKNKQVGLVSGKINVTGQGFDLNTLSLRTQSDIRSIDLMGKSINNLLVDGTLSRKQFNGLVRINDNQARGKINGKVDFSTKRLFADIKGDIDYLNLSYFGVQAAGGNSIFRGQVDGKISFTHINDLNLDATVKNVVLDGNKKIDIPNGKLRASFANGNRVIDVDMPEVVKGEISGKFNLGDLAKMMQNGFDRVLAGNVVKKYYRGQSFTLDFDVSQKLINYFEPNLLIPQGAKISGSYTGNTNDLVLAADIASLKYMMTKKEEISEADQLLAKSNPEYKIQSGRTVKDSAMVDNISLKINTANPEEHLFVRVDRVEYNKNVLKDILINGKNNDNRSLYLTANFKVGTLTEEKNDDLKSYAVSLHQSIDENRDFVVRFAPTELKLNNFLWAVDTSPQLNHSITYRKKTGDFLVKNLRLYSDESEIFVNGQFKNAKDFNVDADVKNMEISKLLALAPGNEKMNITGIANGKIKVKMESNNLEPIIDIAIDNITMNDRNMGNMVINAKNSGLKNIFDVEASIISSELLGSNSLNVKGTIDNNFDSPKLNFDADLKDFDLAFVQEFVKGVFSNMRGKATGLVKLEGNLKNVTYNGDIALKKFGLKVNFSGVDYEFDDTTVNVIDGNLLFSVVGVKDGRSNSKGTISLGQINLGNLSSIGANILIRADNLMMLDTTQKDFDAFWGKVYANGDVFLEFNEKSGLRIDAKETKVLNNSIITFNSNLTSSVDEFKMLKFLKQDEEGVISVDTNKKRGPNMQINLDVSIDRGSTVNVLVGDQVGDISVRGYANNLIFKMDRTGFMQLNGNYYVDNGTYISKAILEKTFTIEKESNIQWSGDALNPELDIVASYNRVVSNAGEYLNINEIPPINVVLEAKISKNMKNPEVSFDIKAPEVSSNVREQLAFKMSSEDEKIIQFGSILLLNNFNVINTGLNINVGNQGVNMLFKQLGSVFSSISNDFQLDFDYISNDAYSNTTERLNTRSSLSVSPRVKLKGAFGIPINKADNPGTQTNYFTGEGTVEYDWSKLNDGSRLLRFYSKPSNIGLVTGSNAGANQNFGLGIAASKSFNRFFPKKKEKEIDKKPKKDSIKKDSVK